MTAPKKGQYIKVTYSLEKNDRYFYAPFFKIRESDNSIIVNMTNIKYEGFSRFEFLTPEELIKLEHCQNNDPDNLKSYKGKLWLKSRKSKTAYYTENGVDFVPVTNVTKA